VTAGTRNTRRDLRDLRDELAEAKFAWRRKRCNHVIDSHPGRHGYGLRLTSALSDRGTHGR
jgi:hypothetical protein